MTDPLARSRLSSSQIEEFHHDLLVDTKVEHFESLCGQFAKQSGGKIVDVGGGCGFGVGVRFRAEVSWVRLFEANGWHVVKYQRGEEEYVSLSRRLLFIRSIRRDSFVLRAQGKVQETAVID